MRDLVKRHENKIRFGLVGGINTALDFVLLFFLSSVGVNRYVANFISTTAAFIFSFFANRTFTFKSAGKAKKQALPFLVVTLTGLWIIQPIIIWICSQIISHPSQEVVLMASKLIATIGSLLWNYILYSKVVFKES